MSASRTLGACAALGLTIVVELFSTGSRALATSPRQPDAGCASARRSRQFAEFLDQAFEQDMARHPIRASRIGIKIYDLMIEQAQNLLRGRPIDDSTSEQVILADFRAKLARQTFDPAVRSDLLARATRAVQNSFAAGYRRLVAHLREARKAATDEAGVWRLPHGDEYYRYSLQSATTLPLDPDELHAYGLHEVARWQHELLKLAPSLPARRHSLDRFSAT